MLGETNYCEIRDEPQDIKTGKKWQSEAVTNQIIATLKHRDMTEVASLILRGCGVRRRLHTLQTVDTEEEKNIYIEQVQKLEAEELELHLIQCFQHSVRAI